MTLDVPKRCETVFSFIFTLAGRSEMRTFYLELLQNFKFEVGHKNVSIYFSLDTLRWTDLLENFLNCRVRPIKKCSSRFVPFHLCNFLGVPLYRDAPTNYISRDCWGESTRKINNCLSGSIKPTSRWWHMLMIWPLWWHWMR